MLGLSLGPRLEDTEGQRWREIYDRAKKRNKVRSVTLGGHTFEYALVNSGDGYGRDKKSTSGRHYEFTGPSVTREVRKEEEHLAGARGVSGLYFVFERNLMGRLDFADYLGLHEHIEGTSLLGRGLAHGLACRIELEEVLKGGEEFIGDYAELRANQTYRRGLPDGYFCRALPKIENVLREGDMPPAQVLRVFRDMLLEEHVRLEKHPSLLYVGRFKLPNRE